MSKKIKKKLRVAVLFGGRSAEHEVSLKSARNVIAALDPEKYDVVEVKIEKSGTGWETLSATKYDIVFPVLHGPFGEDGTMQGLLKLANMPFVGPSVLGSAVSMDKDVMKRLLRDAGIPIARFRAYQRGEMGKRGSGGIRNPFGYPCFVKPANLGSSVGVSKARNTKEFRAAVAHAFQFDRKILVEEYIRGREIECSVLGNEKPIASVPGEIIPSHEFYTYEAKYIDEHGAELVIPAKLTPKQVRSVQDLAVRTFRALACEGMGRVDLFLTPKGKLYVNEINTIPGFTAISMYPKLWEASGIPLSDLVDRLVALALERFAAEQKLKVQRL